jgi:hypothetical protein
MTPLYVCDAIERFLREQLGNMRLPSPGKEESSINFFQMSMPQPCAQDMSPRPEDADGNEIERPQTDEGTPITEGGYSRREARELFPAVIIRPVKLTGASGSQLWEELTVVLTVGSFDESNECVEGQKWVLNILEHIRQSLEKQRILEDRCEISLPLTYELYSEFVRPFWFGEMVTEWNIPVMRQEYGPLDNWQGDYIC